MQIQICDCVFELEIPWRGMHKTSYEYNARRAQEAREQTPLEDLASTPMIVDTALIKRFGDYDMTGSIIDRIEMHGTQQSHTELIRKHSSFFVAKFCHGEAPIRRESLAWKKIMGHSARHVSLD